VRFNGCARDTGADIDDRLAREGFEAALRRLRRAVHNVAAQPWQTPPAHVRATDPDPSVYGRRSGEIALRDRLVAP
jgi:hypothetical protein